MNLMQKNYRVFIAGHNGMVGSSLLKAFKKNDYNNILTVGKKELDLTNKNKVDTWFELNRPEVTILAAAKVGGIYANNSYPVDFLLENLKIQNNVIEASWKYGVKRLLFLGSSCIYPKYAKQPILEEELLTSSLEETNQWYALAKISGLKLCEAYRNQYEFDAFSLMPTNLYGPGDNYHQKNSHVIPGLIRRFNSAAESNSGQVICWGTGSAIREFLHVDDFADACLFTLENWSPKNKELNYLNVGTGSSFTIKELAILIAKETNFKGEIVWDKSKPDGTPKKLLESSKIRNLGWKPSIDFNVGIRDTIKDFKINLKTKNIRL